MSPSLHLIHHSDNPKHFDCNFAIVFPYWDKLFGTYLGEENLKNINGYGIINSEYNRGNPGYCYFVIPLKRVFLSIARFKIPNNI